MPPAILLFVQDMMFGNALREKLKQMKPFIFTTDNGPEALEILSGNHVDIVLLDIRKKSKDALQILADIKKVRKEVEAIVISSTENISNSIECMKEGASDDITAPFDVETLNSKIREALDRREARKKAKRKARFSFFDTFENSMVAATFAQAGEFESAKKIISGQEGNDAGDQEKDEKNNDSKRS